MTGLRKFFIECFWWFFIGAFVAIGVAYCLPSYAFSRNHKVAADTITSPLVAGDATVIVEGCGQQPSVGFAYCRVVENQNVDPSEGIAFHGPPAECRREDACVFFKVWNQAGAVVWGAAITKGQTRIVAPWRKLLGCADLPAPCSFSALWRGIWTVNMVLLWIDKDGRDRESFAQGDIVLRVYSKGYIPLESVAEDPAFVWTWSDGQWDFKSTSGLRSWVGRSKP
jgi:hypothetical protein